MYELIDYVFQFDSNFFYHINILLFSDCFQSFSFPLFSILPLFHR
eukprot:UN17381